MTNIEYKVISKTKVDSETNLKVSKNDALNRIAVEFSSDVCKLVIQKSFQDTHEGRTEAAFFQNTITCTKDLRRYFGLEK